MKPAAPAALLLFLAPALAAAACRAPEREPAAAPGASLVESHEEAREDEGEGARRTGPDGGGFDRLLARFDDNGDGKLQVDELPPRMEDHLGVADANGDGVVTREELKEEMGVRAEARFNARDKDGDGELTPDEVDWMWKHIAVADTDNSGGVTLEELEIAHEERKVGQGIVHGVAHPGKRGWEPGCGRAMDTSMLIERFDRNGDGALEFDEVPDRYLDRLAEADTNHNGALTVDELQARREAREKAHFAKQDKDGDGFLTEAEVGKRWVHVVRADADGDDRVSEEELEAARESGEACDGPTGEEAPGPPAGRSPGDK